MKILLKTLILFSLISLQGCGLMMTVGVGYYLSQDKDIYIPPEVTIVTPTTINGIKNIAFTQTYSTETGTSPFQWNAISENLPSGLSLNSSTGELSGIPDTAGTYNFYLTATDANNKSDSIPIQIIIYDTLVINNNNLIDGSINKEYSVTIESSGGLAPYSYELVTGNLPENLSLSSTGIISGIVSNTASGDYIFTVRSTDSNETSLLQSVTKQFTISINTESITVLTPNNIENIKAGSQYDITWESTGYIPNVNIELWKNSTKISDIETNLENTGSYQWSLSNNLTPDTDYQIKIVNSTDITINDYSDNNFSVIWKLEITAPADFEELEIGSTYTIQWNTYGNITNIDIELWKNNIKLSDIILNENNNNSYGWTIPFSLDLGTDYKINIINSSDISMTDLSSENFTISARNNVFAGGYINDGTNNIAHIKRFSSDGNEDTLNWNKNLFNTSSNVGKICKDSNENIFVCGYVSNGTDDDIYIKKYNIKGVEDLNWNIIYDSGELDRANSIDIDSNGNVYICGKSYSTETIAVVKKYASDGTEDTTNFPFTFAEGDRSTFWDIKIYNTDIYIAGTYGTNIYHWFTTKLNSNGIEDTTNWHKTWYISSTSACKAYEIRVNNGYIYTTGVDDSKYVIYKYNTNGDLITNFPIIKPYNEFTEAGFSLCFDEDNNIYSCGYYRLNISYTKWWLNKFSENGTEDTDNWNKQISFSTDGIEIPIASETDLKGNVYFGGYTNSLTEDYNWRILKYSLDGTEDTDNWNKEIGDEYSDKLNCLYIIK